MCKKYGSTFLVRLYAWWTAGKIWFMTDCRLLSLAGFSHSKKLQSIETKTVDLIWGKIRRFDYHSTYFKWCTTDARWNVVAFWARPFWIEVCFGLRKFGMATARPGDLVRNHELASDKLCVSITINQQRSESAGQTFQIFGRKIDLILIEKSWRYLTWNGFLKIWLFVIKNDSVEAERSINMSDCIVISILSQKETNSKNLNVFGMFTWIFGTVWDPDQSELLFCLHEVFQCIKGWIFDFWFGVVVVL